MSGKRPGRGPLLAHFVVVAHSQMRNDGFNQLLIHVANDLPHDIEVSLRRVVRRRAKAALPTLPSRSAEL